jgi:hypothetical protein
MKMVLAQEIELLLKVCGRDSHPIAVLGAEPVIDEYGNRRLTRHDSISKEAKR